MATKKYGDKASDKVEAAMHEMKRGTLRSGSGRKVTDRKQAVAIGLSEARKEGGKVPDAPGKKRTAPKKKPSTRKRAATREKTAAPKKRATQTKRATQKTRATPKKRTDAKKQA